MRIRLHENYHGSIRGDVGNACTAPNEPTFQLKLLIKQKVKWPLNMNDT